jgi:CheY-like chemotaxis protein
LATVLVVEDEILISMLIEDALREAGHTVVTALNAAAAINVLKGDSSITLVFTDVDMPGSMDVLKLAAYVRGRWPPVLIDDFRFQNRMPTRAAAVRELLKRGLATVGDAAGPGMKSSNHGVFSRGPGGHMDGEGSPE